MTKSANLKSDSHSPDLEIQALALFNSRKFKEATDLFKQLLQHSDHAEWRQNLAVCYLQRARDFALKGLYKEAVVLWENYQQHAQPPLQMFDHYLIWLFQSANTSRIQSAIKQLTAEQLDKDYPELAMLLGALILSGHTEYQTACPQDSQFIVHLNLVQSALQAYRNHDQDGMEQALNQLPYRSAFRDLRTLLKAALKSSSTPGEARALLTKIPSSSPYSQTARLLRACLCQGSELVKELLNCNHAQRRFIEQFIGLHQLQSELLESLCKQKQPWPNKFKFSLAIQYTSLFGPDTAQDYCFSLLGEYPAGQNEFDKAFGSLANFDLNRLKALSLEEKDKLFDAEYYWKQCIKQLSQQDSDTGLQIALIYRRMAANHSNPADKIEYLCQSLQYDPGDRESYLCIIDHFSDTPAATDELTHWLQQALKHCPQDIPILTKASSAATAQQDYALAIQFSADILKLDPVNSYAKEIVFASHLAQARKLIKAKNTALASKEIQQAEALKLGKAQTRLTELMTGLLCYATQDKQQGLETVVNTLNQLNPDPASAQFQATLEAIMTGLPVATLLRELPAAKDELISAPALTRLMQLIEQYGRDTEQRTLLLKALDKIKPQLKKSLQQFNYPESLQLDFCRTLATLQHFELLRVCAKSGQEQWPKPLWLYYKIFADSNGDPAKLTFMQRCSLQLNLNEAYQNKDLRAQTLINRYLEHYEVLMMPSEFAPHVQAYDPEAGDEEAYDDPIFALYGHLPDDLFEKIDLKADLIARKTAPPKLIQDIMKLTGNPPDLLSRMQQDPDLFSALLLLKAANELKIDVEVSVQSILDYFGLPS